MGPERNNFKELFQEEERRFQESQRGEDNVGASIWRSLGFFKLIGQVVEVFVPKVFELIIAALGGDIHKMERGEAHHRPPSLGPDEDPRAIQPGGPEEDDPVRGPEPI